MSEFNGLGLHLGNLSRLSKAQTRSISPENFTGEKGKGGMSVDGPAANAARGLGLGWKVSPYIIVAAGMNRHRTGMALTRLLTEWHGAVARCRSSD